MADVNAEADSPPGPSEGNAVNANNHGDVPPRGGRRLVVPLPAKLEMRGDMVSNWRRFDRMWRNYEIVTRLGEETDEFRTATLLTCIGSEALDVYEGLPFEENERQNVAVVLKSLRNSVWERSMRSTSHTCFSAETRMRERLLNLISRR